MQVDNPDKIRNLAVVGHNDTGKTTLVSAALFGSGVTTRLNKVEDGNTVTDFDAEEIGRSISIGTAVAFAGQKYIGFAVFRTNRAGPRSCHEPVT